MPACGTVTTSPPCRRMLFFASPASKRSARLTVIVLPIGGGSAAEDGIGGGAFCVVEAADCASAAPAAEAELKGFDCEEGSAEFEGGKASAGLIGGGSMVLERAEGSGRVTMTVSPASLAMPPACARTSRSVVGRSASYTIGCATAPTTVIGLLLFSFTVTPTCG